MSQFGAQNVITDLYFCNNFPTFVQEMDTSMETTVIRIGNSKGIIIPAAILKRMGAKEGSKVKLEENETGLTLSFTEEEEPFTGPFTGPFKDLPHDEESWGGKEMSALEYARLLHDSRVNTRETPQW